MQDKLVNALLLASLSFPACGGGGGDDGGDGAGADAGAATDARQDLSPDSGGEADTDAGSTETSLNSTLTSDCGATLQGRAIVNFNGNLGISFTEDSGAFTFLGSIQFELPSGFTGSVNNPEGWDGQSERHVIAASNTSFTTHGNHCWFDTSPSNPGSVTISDYRPNEGIVKATFNGLQLKSCIGATMCTINGSIETTGQGVFD